MGHCALLCRTSSSNSDGTEATAALKKARPEEASFGDEEPREDKETQGEKEKEQEREEEEHLSSSMDDQKNSATSSALLGLVSYSSDSSDTDS